MTEKALQKGGAAAAGVSAGANSIYSELHALHDPFFFLVGILGAIISLSATLYDFYHAEDRVNWRVLLTDLIKGFIAGALLAPFVFMSLNAFGNAGLHRIDENLTVTDKTVWFLFSLALSWGAVNLLDAIIAIPKAIISFIKNRLGG